jgi:hypothetical protein
MERFGAFLIFLFLFSAAPCAQAQSTFYVFSDNSLEIRYGNPAANYTRWQVWLFQEGVRLPHHTVGLQYSRWGLIEGTSAASVMQRLRAFQNFEEAYLNFFGPNTWGRYTFSNPLGPIAVAGRAIEIQPGVLEKRYQLAGLDDRLNRLIALVRPSLENNESESLNSPVKEYFDQIRHALEQVIRSYSQLARIQPRLHFIELEIAQTQPPIVQAEKLVPKIFTVLPSVKLPADRSWMSQTQKAGSDGTIEVIISEIGSGVSVQQTWTGGDGSMTGTVIVTTIPYNEIGNIDLVSPASLADPLWIVRVHEARDPFAQKIDSPPRRTIRRAFPAVHLTTTESSVYFVFHNSAEAQDALAYFLYHKQLGR